MAAYTYSKLDEATFQIRLLTLKPAEEWSADLECDLESTVFESAPSYEALSYTWGDARNRQDILVNGKSSTITENLGVALRYIRRKDAARTLWVDALCINQSDVDECSQQVRRMLDIFKRATRVLAWLGAPGDDSDEALSLLTEFGQFMLDLLRHDRSAPGDHAVMRPDAMLAKGFDMSSKNWSALWKFWNRPYWSRVWIIQELASRANLDGMLQARGDGTDVCVIGCGHRWVPFTVHCCAIAYFVMWFNLVSDSCVIIGDETIQYAEPLKSLRIEGPIQAQRVYTALRTSSSNCENSIHSLMIATRTCKATDVRDKIYALLGISYERIGILPDYSKPANMVFQDLVRFHIENYRMTATHYQLEILSGNRYGQEIGPSWTPEPYGPAPSSHLFQPQYNDFSAGGKTCDTSQVAFPPGQSLLSSVGCPVDVIDEVIGPLERVQQVETDLASLHPSLKGLLVGLMKLAQSLSEEDWIKFWRTTLGDQDHVDYDNIVRPAPEDLGKKAGAYFRGDPLPNEFMPDGPYFTQWMRWIDSYEVQLLSNLTERCFFTTKKGHMGIGPKRTKQGDLAVVLFGGTFCFVLRPVGHEYKLIGDAYVHGVMHGELLKEHQEGRLASEVFTLR